MKQHRFVRLALVLVFSLGVSACQTTGKPDIVLSEKSSLELRSIQTRAYEEGNETKIVRTIVATFLDLGYTVDKVEPNLGTVSATKLAHLKMTAVASNKSPNRTLVRANAIIDMPEIRQQVDSPEFYQKLFFEPLSKALFLSALEISDGDIAPEIQLPEKNPEKSSKP